MAPLPANSTNRLFIDYVTGDQATSQEHTLGMRYASTATPQEAQESVAEFLSGVGAGTFKTGWRVLRARFQLAGGNVTLPVNLITTLGSFQGTSSGSLSSSSEAREWRWVGRSYPDGRRSGVSLYGLTATFPENFRYPLGGASPPWIANSIGALLVAEPQWLGIGGDPILWYEYVNVQYNSYWERRLRSV